MTTLYQHSISANGRLINLSTPKVMGILNITPDSFFAGSRKKTDREIAERVMQITEEGADIIDIGAYSSRPDAQDVSAEEEADRLRRALPIVKEAAPDAVISIDTFRADIARMCVEEYGADIINDIAGGELDTDMFDTIARLKVPYIMMHMKGTPQNMQKHTVYGNMRKEIMYYFAEKIQKLQSMGVNDIILDPGFGFSKTLEQNYELLAHLKEFKALEVPILAGISRKSMLYRLLGTDPEHALNATTAANAIALNNGADILRVHDVKECVELIKIFNKTNEQK